MASVSFANQVVIVTGAGGALGRSYAREVARRGGAVVVNDLGGSVPGVGESHDAADKVVAEIRSAGGRAVANYDSVATRDGARRIAAAAIDNFGRIDALINNAGNMRFARFTDVPEQDLAAVLAVHLVGTFNVTQAVWPHLQAQRYGRVVFTSSSAGMLGNPEMTSYGAAKAGIAGLMNVLSQEGAPYGILCNALLPNAMSRMGQFVAEAATEATQPNPHVAAIMPAMDPAFTAGITVYLASSACTSTHSIYSALGGRIARAFVGVTEGWRRADMTPPSVDEIAANIATIRDVSKGFQIPVDLKDEYGIVARAIHDRKYG
jgi:NAD(P)-dependent dehydrogenase (short-subunit alcohol dehydrogenase family)